MEVSGNIPFVLKQYGLNADDFRIGQIGSGHINTTYHLQGTTSYILQKINTTVFKKPEQIAKNIRLAANYLKEIYPSYLFLSPVQTSAKSEMAWDEANSPWRMFPFLEGSYTVDKLDHPMEAYEAARGFGSLNQKLEKIPLKGFEPTIPGFHNLEWRYNQFEEALAKSKEEVRISAGASIQKAIHFSHLVKEYNNLIQSGRLPERIVHNDTKINNLLFDRNTKKALCVIDLDTLMQGYYIYDLGDMIRTFVSPVSEEEKNTMQILFRHEFYDALIEGYTIEMKQSLSSEEKKAIPFSGLMMTYIMALRFLTDFLNGNKYYNIHYPEQNLVRASNQLTLLEKIQEKIRPVY